MDIRIVKALDLVEKPGKRCCCLGHPLYPE